MKCPKCGATIPNESLYCYKCGEEVKIVPEFEPEVENKIDETLSSLVNDIDDNADKKTFEDSNYEYDENYYEDSDSEDFDDDTNDDFDNTGNANFPSKIGPFMYFLAFIVIVLLIVAIIFVLQIGTGGSTGHKQTSTSVASSKSIEDNTTTSADSSSSMSTSDDLAESDSAKPNTPVISVDSGTYDTAISIDIIADEGSVYYTINGDTPTSEDTIYNGIDAIELDEDGTYVLQVVLIDEGGNVSDVATATYVIELEKPDDPTILEDSGSYTTDTQIVAVSEDGVSIYYTTDGTTPTSSSTKYTGPITMPYGESTYKFIAIDNESGACSSVVTRQYSFHYPTNITHAEAVSLLLDALIEKGYVQDGNGTVAGLDGYNLYQISSTSVIANADYYVIVENHVYSDGTTTTTGLLYAVNVTTGSVYRLGSDTSGNYFLKALT